MDWVISYISVEGHTINITLNLLYLVDASYLSSKSYKHPHEWSQLNPNGNTEGRAFAKSNSMLSRGLPTWLLPRQEVTTTEALGSFQWGGDIVQNRTWPIGRHAHFHPGPSSSVFTLTSQPIYLCQSFSSTHKRFIQSLAPTYSISTLTKLFWGSPSPLRNFLHYQIRNPLNSKVKAKIKCQRFVQQKQNFPL